MTKFLTSIIAGMLCCGVATAEDLVILHTNDTHSQIDPNKYGLGGVGRRKALVDSVRSVQDNVLLIDLGDIVQGTLFFNLYKGEVEEKVMNAIGYDLRILGNHEFDNGMETLAQNLHQANAELLCCNYDLTQTPLNGLFKPYTIKEYAGKRIAFLPINLQPQGMISSRNIQGLRYIDGIETAKNMAWYLRNVEHADYVIALTHIGYEEDCDIASQTTGIDMILGGHSHTLVNPNNPKSVAYLAKNAEGVDVLVAQEGHAGEYLGEIRINLDDLSQTPKYQLLTVDSRLDDRVDPAVEEMIAPYRAEIDRLNNNVVTTAVKRFDRSGPELLNFLADVVEMKGKEIVPDIDMSLVNKGGIRNSIERGPVTEGELITINPFFNKILIIEVSGDSLLTAFETMARQRGQGVSSNVEAVYDPETTALLDVKISGKEIDPSRMYRIATLDYLANGGDYQHALVDHKLLGQSVNYVFEDVLEYFRQGPGKGKKWNPSDQVRMHAK